MDNKEQEELNLKELITYMKENFDDKAFAKLDRQGFYNIFINADDTKEQEVWGISKNEYEAWSNALDKLTNYFEFEDLKKSKKTINKENINVLGIE